MKGSRGIIYWSKQRSLALPWQWENRRKSRPSNAFVRLYLPIVSNVILARGTVPSQNKALARSPPEGSPDHVPASKGMAMKHRNGGASEFRFAGLHHCFCTSSQR